MAFASAVKMVEAGMPWGTPTVDDLWLPYVMSVDLKQGTVLSRHIMQKRSLCFCLMSIESTTKSLPTRPE